MPTIYGKANAMLGIMVNEYTHRFSPRTSSSAWSLINARRAGELIALKRMAAPGLEAFRRRDPKKTGYSSFENRPSTFDAALECRFRIDAAGRKFFRAQPPGYQRLMTFWVMSAKRQETRQRRLAALVRSSAGGKRIR